MPSGIYNTFKSDIMSKVTNLHTAGDTIKVALMTTSHAFTATHNLWTDVSANELANGNGYTTNGATLANQAVTKAATTKWDGDDVAWTSSTFTAYHAVIYDSTTGRLIASIDFGGAKAVSSGTFTISWNAGGIVTLA